MAILDNLIEKKDLMSLLKFRKEHLILEKQKVPFTIKDKTMIERAIIKLNGRIEEINFINKTIKDKTIKDKSKFEFSKVQYLKKVKIQHIKQLNSDGTRNSPQA